MKVLIVGGPKDGQMLEINQPAHGISELRFAVHSGCSSNFFDENVDLSVKPDFRTVVNRLHSRMICLPNGKECTLILAVTEEAMDAMTIPVWLELLSTACKEGCIL